MVPRWFTGELFGAFLLVFFGCGSVGSAVLTRAQVDDRRDYRPDCHSAYLDPGTVTMACFIPSRDFAPRLYSGWPVGAAGLFQACGIGWLTFYIFAPLAGGLLGSARTGFL